MNLASCHRRSARYRSRRFTAAPGPRPFEYEVVPPNDGDCWAFSDAPGHDLTVLGVTMLDATLTITRLEFDVTFAQ